MAGFRLSALARILQKRGGDGNWIAAGLISGDVQEDRSGNDACPAISGFPSGGQMNKHFSAIPVAFLGFILALPVLSGQDKPQESVTVTAVEIPVRVFDGNGFVSGLTKDDFEVYENGIRQDISGFEAVSRSILPSSDTLPEPIPKLPRKRNFILIFNVFAYSDQIGEAIDFFFKNVFRPGDRLVTLVNEGLVQLKGEGSGEDIAARLKELLLKVKKERGQELAKIFLFLEKRAENLDLALRGDATSDYFVADGDVMASTKLFNDDYRRTWGDYRSRRLDVNLELYKSIADKMGKLDGDKWAICFQQRDIFPKIKHGGRLDEDMRGAVSGQIGSDPRADLIQAQMDEIDRSLDVSDNFPGDKIRELFTQANITFHVLIMKAVASQARESEDMDVREVRADYEDTLRRISRATGGLTAFSNDVLETLKEASAKPDQYYLLVYQPKKGLTSPENKIEVRVLRKNVDIVSLKSRTPVKAEGITIFDFEAGPKSIAFRLKNYARAPLEWKERGRAAIKVTIFDDQSAKAFFKETTLDLVAETIRLSLDLNAPPPGSYFVVIEAYDVVSGEKAVFSSSIVLE